MAATSNQSTPRTISLRFSFRAKIVVLLSAWFIVFLPVYPHLWHTWMNDSNSSYGLLVPLISAFIIWNKRNEISKAHLSYSYWGAVILVSSFILYLLALAGHVAVAQRLMIVASLNALVLFNFGKDVYRLLAFPLLYLLFMVPIPVSIYGLVAFPLQLFATNISHYIIQGVNIPVLQEGNMLYFAQTQLEVAEACSGLRSMTAFIMLSVLFAYLMRKGWWHRGLLVCSAIPLAIVANIIRVTGTGILAHFYGKQVARGFLHEFSGLFVFVFGLLLMFALYSLLNRISEKRL